MPVEAGHGVSSRASQAAARVAARYAKAPSFSQLQAVEAQTAVRAARIATQVAIEAQAVAHAALAGLEAASGQSPARTSESAHPAMAERAFSSAPLPLAVSPLRDPFAEQTPTIRWPQEMPVRHEVPSAAAAARKAENSKAPTVDWQQLESLGHGSPSAGELEPVEPDQPIHANLIEFPRELVATRKVRTRQPEEPHAQVEDPAGQLSIFEVDPGAISYEAAPPADIAPPQTFEWSSIKLEAQPIAEAEPLLQPPPAPAVLNLAPLSRRLLAAVVDSALIAVAFLAAAAIAAAFLEHLPEMKLLEVGAVAALLVTGLLYQSLFSALTEATPGMRYAGISLCTFDDQCPTRAQRCGRLGALLLSLLPVGLGAAWAIFDEEHLSWHDRLSKTYQRRS